jgi:hypothetical protein
MHVVGTGIFVGDNLKSDSQLFKKQCKLEIGSVLLLFPLDKAK